MFDQARKHDVGGRECSPRPRDDSHDSTAGDISKCAGVRGQRNEIESAVSKGNASRGQGRDLDQGAKDSDSFAQVGVMREVTFPTRIEIHRPFARESIRGDARDVKVSLEAWRVGVDEPDGTCGDLSACSWSR
jgi:hypothetical protein